jgi:hypothetical protein
MAGWLDQERAYYTWVEMGGGEKGARGGRLAAPGESLLYLGRGGGGEKGARDGRLAGSGESLLYLGRDGRRGEGSQGWQVGCTRREPTIPG